MTNGGNGPQGENLSTRTGDGYDGDARVAAILSLIANGTFIPGKSTKELAEHWGLERNTVSNYVARAFQFVRMHRLGLEDDINRRLACIEEDRRLAQARVRCFAHKGEVISREPAPDVASMIAADRLYLETIGALIRTKQTRDGDDVDLGELLRIEVRGNPALARMVLASLPREEVRQLVDATEESKHDET